MQTGSSIVCDDTVTDFQSLWTSDDSVMFIVVHLRGSHSKGIPVKSKDVIPTETDATVRVWLHSQVG